MTLGAWRTRPPSINEAQATTKERCPTVSATLNLKRQGTIAELRRKPFEIARDGTVQFGATGAHTDEPAHAA